MHSVRQGERLMSIDALRGFDMFWIIGGGTIFHSLRQINDNPVTNFISTQMEHVSWEGFHFEDLIFPLFLFIVGLVLPFSISHRPGKAKLFLHIIKRSAVLILLGMVLNGLLKFNFPAMRWAGVLQRIGLCYFFAAIIVMFTKWRTQAIITGIILLLYWALLVFVPVPGFGPGILTPEGCLASYIDQLLLPGKFCCFGYGDNEGLLSTLPSVATVLIGVLAGHWLRTDHSGNRKTAALLLSGVLCLGAGYIWGLCFPIIKVIWTSSYVLVAGGWSLILFALFYWIIEVKGFKKWAFFFVIIGINPITIYALQWVVNFDDIARVFTEGLAALTGSAEIMVIAIGTLAVKWLFLYLLYRHKIFFKA